MIKRSILITYFFFYGCSSGGSPMSENIRPPAVAGMWYPAEKQELQEMISQFLLQAETQKEVQPQIEGKLYGIIVPHAGYEYSGQTAAYAFKQLLTLKFETVIILGPYHGPKHPNAPTTSFRGVSVWNTGAFKSYYEEWCSI